MNCDAAPGLAALPHRSKHARDNISKFGSGEYSRADLNHIYIADGGSGALKIYDGTRARQK